MRLTSLFIGSLLGTLALTAHAHEHKHDHHDHEHAHEKEHHEHEGASLDAHEHGVASLNLVLEGGDLMLELESPAANIVGFEHMPTAEADLTKVRQARERLQQAESLFVLPGQAECRLEEAETESPLFAALETEHAAHGDAHGHDDHEHNDHGHDKHAESHGDHADIDARFHFVCANPAALEQIEVKLFEAFPGTEKLLIQAITPKGQQGGELTPAQNVIRL